MDSKGVSPLIGFVLLLAIIMGFIGIVQSSWVPEWNKAVEAEHLSDLESEISEIPKIMFISATTGKQGAVSVDAGCEYPSRVFLINPPTASTTLTAAPLWINITFNETLPNGNTFHYTNNFSTHAIIIQPNYFYIQRPEVIIEHSAIVKASENSVIDVSSPISFAKNKVHLFILNSTFSSISSTRTLSLHFNPVSYGGEVFVENTTITIKVLDETFNWWNNTLKDIFGAGNVTADESSKEIAIKLYNSTLSLSYLIAQASSGGSVEVSSETAPYRLQPLSESNYTVYKGTTIPLGVRVVDKFNNPVRNVNVSINDSCHDILTKTTNDKGEVWYYFSADSPGTWRVEFNVSDDNVSYEINVSGRGFWISFRPVVKDSVNAYYGPIDGVIDSSPPSSLSPSVLINDGEWKKYDYYELLMTADNDGEYLEVETIADLENHENHASQLFEFNVGDVQTSKLNFVWNGYAYFWRKNNWNDGVVLYVWNGSGWEYLCHTILSDEVWLACEKSGDYVDKKGKVYVLAVQDNWEADYTRYSHIYTDYIELDLFT